MVNEIVFQSHAASEIMSGFAAYFKTKTQDDKAGISISIPAVYGEGFINMLDFRNGMTMFSFCGALRKDLVIRFRYHAPPPLRMIFCVQNDLKHLIRGDRIQYQLTDLLGSLVCGTSGNEQIFFLPGEKSVNYYCIEIDRERYNAVLGESLSTLPPDLREAFSDVRGKQSFLYQGNYSLTIAQGIQNIKSTSYTGLVKRVFVEAQTLEIMAMQIKQFIDDREPSNRQSVLRKRDMELIIEARNRLLADLIKPPTVKELAQLTGTNENKLKKGFRLLYNTSINKLLQNERLSKAKLLIAEESYPIKEIARMVGYRHCGHFTSKFKKKFGVLPKEYIKSMTG